MVLLFQAALRNMRVGRTRTLADAEVHAVERAGRAELLHQPLCLDRVRHGSYLSDAVGAGRTNNPPFGCDNVLYGNSVIGSTRQVTVRAFATPR
jgi:hypothetical protein